MLPKQARLRALEVKEVLKQGKVARAHTAPHLSVKFIKGGGSFRSAIVVPKSTVRGAVARNSLRRALYRALKELSPTLSARAVFFVQRIPPTPRTLLLRSEAELLLKKIQ